MNGTQTLLITGASGVIGLELARQIASFHTYSVIGLDVVYPPKEFQKYFSEFFKGSVLDHKLIQSIMSSYTPQKIFHLAAILLLESEKNPAKTQAINAGGTATMMEITFEEAQKKQLTTQFLYPSSIGIHGGVDSPLGFGYPSTMYGVTKLYGEMLGCYYDSQSIIEGSKGRFFDFRSVRLPGTIGKIQTDESKLHISSYLLHSPATEHGFELYVDPNLALPFITLYDAARSLILLSDAKRETLSSRVYDVFGLEVALNEIAEKISLAFDDAAYSLNPDIKKQTIIDSWPRVLDDSKARMEWGWKPEIDTIVKLSDYLQKN